MQISICGFSDIGLNSKRNSIGKSERKLQPRILRRGGQQPRARSHSQPRRQEISGEVVPSALDAGPPATKWRRQRLAGRDGGSMFIDLLVVVDENATNLHGLEVALRIAHARRCDHPWPSPGLFGRTDRF